MTLLLVDPPALSSVLYDARFSSALSAKAKWQRQSGNLFRNDPVPQTKRELAQHEICSPKGMETKVAVTGGRHIRVTLDEDLGKGGDIGHIGTEAKIGPAGCQYSLEMQE